MGPKPNQTGIVRRDTPAPIGLSIRSCKIAATKAGRHSPHAGLWVEIDSFIGKNLDALGKDPLAGIPLPPEMQSPELTSEKARTIKARSLSTQARNRLSERENLDYVVRCVIDADIPSNQNFVLFVRRKVSA